MNNRTQEIIDSLSSKKVIMPCPRCGNKSFSLVGESEIVIKRIDGGGLLSMFASPPMSLPVIVVTCDNCGFVSQHAKAALNLLQNEATGFGILGGRTP